MQRDKGKNVVMMLRIDGLISPRLRYRGTVAAKAVCCGSEIGRITDSELTVGIKYVS